MNESDVYEQVAVINSAGLQKLTDSLGGHKSLCTKQKECRCSPDPIQDYVYIPGDYVLLITLPVSEENK